MLALLLSIVAQASDCPDVAQTLRKAWASFDDAELTEALEELDAASESLACQSRLVETREIVELYTLEGLIALAQEDQSLAIYATIRIVTTDPDDKPDESLGPEFAELHHTWSERLSASHVALTWTGDGSAWVDGRPLPVGAPTAVIAGEHLLQVERPDGWIGLSLDVGSDAEVRVEGEQIKLRAPDPSGVPTPEPAPSPRPSSKHRRHRVGLVVASGLAVAAGAASIAYGFDRDQRFRADPYDADAYGGCALGTACYEAERARRIRTDATIVNGLYGGGYGLTGLGVAALGLELFVLPEPAAGGGSVQVRVHW